MLAGTFHNPHIADISDVTYIFCEETEGMQELKMA